MDSEPRTRSRTGSPIEGLTRTHWGIYHLTTDGREATGLRPFESDPDPSDIGLSLLDMGDSRLRIRRPHVRRGWLEAGRGPSIGRRGRDEFLALDWDEALDLAANELRRVIREFGNSAIFGGSYGWASAGRFHHAQSQVHRFLNTIGGYTSHKGTYSCGAAHVIVPHILGFPFSDVLDHQTPSWPIIADNTQIVVMFGGIALKNTQVTAGGNARHDTRDWLLRCRRSGVSFVNVSPCSEDAWEGLEAEWIPVRPNTDTALMLGLAFTLETEGLLDRDFLRTHACGYERFRAYLLGESDGVRKDANWAARITGIGANTIQTLARRMAGGRCLISVSWSLQRAENGEQPYWMATVLAAMLGQIGLAGGGIAYGLGSLGEIGNPALHFGGLVLPQGQNPVSQYIPVARIADMLLHPGEPYRYDGRTLTYPEIHLVYWCGGNPFHHHQDLFRLREAWDRPDTVIVHEPWWTATAKHADIVFPVATPLERNDIGRTSGDDFIVAMRALLEPVGEARTDFAIFSALAERLGVHEAFTNERDEMQWLEHLYEGFRAEMGDRGCAMPGFAEFWQGEPIELPVQGTDHAVIGFQEFRLDANEHPLPTPSGRIEIYSETIAGFGGAVRAGHPVWIEPMEWLGSDNASRYGLHLISPQPAGKLHSQLDFGRTSRAGKRRDREVAAINPVSAAQRGICDGDVVRIFNDRGACLATARITETIAPGVLSLPTGSWFDPASSGHNEPRLDRHGNPNVLTRDAGTSEIAQGTIANSALVEAEPFRGDPPRISAFDPPSVLDERRTGRPRFDEV